MVSSHASRILIFVLLANILAAVLYFFAPPALAQNMNQFQEEEIKDKERALKKKQLEDQRKAEEAKTLSQPVTEEELEKSNLVEVQPLNVLPSDLTSSYRLLPYKFRRLKWGHQISIGYSQYQPVNYQTEYSSPGTGSYGYFYGTATPLIELNYTYRYNWSLGGIGLDIAYGYFQGASPSLNSTLTVQPIRVGGKLILDTLFSEPYAVPFVFGGVYEALFSENQGNVTFSGNTQMALYYGAGIMAQLNWLDRAASLESYNQSGIENTYFFVEVRQYQSSSSGNDPNLGSNVSLGAGLSMEF